MVNTREIAKEYRLSHWAQIMQERIQSGQSIKAYCHEKMICVNTYHYWQRRLREAACEQLALSASENEREGLPVFAEVNVRELARVKPEDRSGRLCMEVAGISITADASYPTDKLASLLRELARV